MTSVDPKFSTKQFSDRTYKAKDFNINPELSKGPMKERKCTDLLCLIVFLAFLVGMGIFTAQGYIHGQPGMVVAPIDGDARFCGHSEGVEGYGHLWIADISSAVDNIAYGSSIFNYGVCVKECPNSGDESIECVDTEETQNCDSFSIYGTYDLLGYCWPAASNELPSNVQDSYVDLKASFTAVVGGDTISSLENSWHVILVCVLITIVFSFAYLKFMDWCADTVAWLTVAIIQISLCTLCYIAYDWQQWYLNKENQDYADYSSYVMWGTGFLAGIYYILIVCFFKDLRLAIAIIETASDFFADTKRVALVPVVYFGVAIITFGLWLVCFVSAASMGEISPISVATQTRTVTRSDDETLIVYYMLFGILWIMAFILAANEFAIICAAATWYYSNKDEEDSDGIAGDSDVLEGLSWTYRYHLGSLAFGSLMVAIVWAIRIVFEYLGEKIQGSAPGNKATQCMVTSIRCCLDCFDRLLRYLNRQAYIYMAISSEGFCSSAINSFCLLLKNAAKFGFVQLLSEVFIFLAKFCISISTTMACYFLLKYWATDVTDYMPAMAIVFVISMIVSAIFISIFDIGSNTILMCYLVDRDISKQSPEALEQKHIPETLMRFLKLNPSPDTSDDEEEDNFKKVNQVN